MRMYGRQLDVKGGGIRHLTLSLDILKHQNRRKNKLYQILLI
jgi:hypothetical protein